MPRIEPTEFNCETCGYQGIVHAEPVHCRCGTIVMVDGTVLERRPILYRPGDMVAVAAEPIARAIGLTKNKKKCGGCDKRRKAMNALTATEPDPE